MVENRQFSKREDFFQTVFEIARRHKIMNPEKMRTSYCKLMYMLQDARSEKIRSLLEFDVFCPLTTVYSVLKSAGAESMLSDPLMAVATMECPDDKTKTRYQLNERIRTKQKAIRKLSRKYSTSQLDEDDIGQLLYAIGDNSSFLAFHRDPIDKMISLLTAFFSPDEVRDGFSLSIVARDNEEDSSSSRLTHSHGRQFHYVLQSLLLWREVTNHMFKLWCLAESDLTKSNSKLTQTGQGLNRVQASPLVMNAMRKILHDTQKKCEKWIGSSVIHMGDTQVPNSIFFIDKYTQVSRILRPIITAIEQIPFVCKRKGIAVYVDSVFGGQKRLINVILHDFFRRGFDGGGARNFFDAGSCIDGRLTSAWNWCSELHKKPFYPIFKLTGFTSFDGAEFQE